MPLVRFQFFLFTTAPSRPSLTRLFDLPCAEGSWAAAPSPKVRSAKAAQKRAAQPAEKQLSPLLGDFHSFFAFKAFPCSHTAAHLLRALSSCIAKPNEIFRGLHSPNLTKFFSKQKPPHRAAFAFSILRLLSVPALCKMPAAAKPCKRAQQQQHAKPGEIRCAAALKERDVR